MASRPRRNHAPAFKAQVALAALKGDKTLAEWAQQHDSHPKPDHRWEDATVGTGGPGIRRRSVCRVAGPQDPARQDWRTDPGE